MKSMKTPLKAPMKKAVKATTAKVEGPSDIEVEPFEVVYSFCQACGRMNEVAASDGDGYVFGECVCKLCSGVLEIHTAVIG